ncbi:DUF3077 domain-containing protein [Pseudomonas sp. HR96]|uniref:DUF3077 domain-containing protein n=1 Tax=Pseudomonas sp. HR96 TaxID=1027966 RepID=UPI002A74ADB7|nr:DUF3077 domain-containing protein [Pseudomonas sp. HR96]WPO99809.1 DUF3077 domain-containing protein [Pseudomonas sp. HR96]
MDTTAPCLTQAIPFARGITGEPLFLVQAGIPISAALTQASLLLDGLEAVVNEAAESVNDESRPLVRLAVHHVEMIRALVESAIKAA